MSGIKEELTRSWLTKAKRDLLSAERLSGTDVPLLDTAAYHCQQAAEKAIKAFLVYHDVRFGKTHDLDVLLSQAVEIDSAFSSCRDLGRVLTPLAVEFRYPGEFIEPEPDEYSEAFAAAVRICDFVGEHLPVTCRV